MKIVDWGSDGKWEWVELWLEGTNKDEFEKFLNGLGFSCSCRISLPSGGEKLYGKAEKYDAYSSWTFFPQAGFAYGWIDRKLENIPTRDSDLTLHVAGD